MPTVLGLHGKAGSGKDTIADYLIQKLPNARKASYAGNLRWICQEVFKLSDHQVSTQLGKMEFFDKPIVFSMLNLTAIMVIMSKTHANVKIPSERIKAVRDLVGTELENPRRVLQFVGTEVCRGLVPTYHVDIVRHNINSGHTDDTVILTDVRFPDEADLIIEEFSGKVLHILREDVTAAQNIDRTHSSENAMQDWNKFSGIINNNREGLDALYMEINRFLERNGLCQNAAQTD